MALLPSQPIGVFDSGIGGLTVAHAIRQLLPNESMIYFGDTAHLPYGDKSEAAIQAYSIKIADILVRKGCKIIVIACNSASSAAYELLTEYVRKDIHIINVIDPMVSLVFDQFQGKSVGLIGTKRTVQSGVYNRKIEEGNKSIAINSVATPLLAPMIEEGFFNNKISRTIINSYLSRPKIKKIDALILACTHYPLIKPEIEEYYKKNIFIVDAADIVAHRVHHLLGAHQLLNPGTKGKHRFFISDFTKSFEESTKIFFRGKIRLEHLNLWK